MEEKRREVDDKFDERSIGCCGGCCDDKPGSVVGNGDGSYFQVETYNDLIEDDDSFYNIVKGKLQDVLSIADEFFTALIRFYVATHHDNLEKLNSNSNSASSSSLS